MIRKFRLINGEGVSWDLNARTSFLHSIGGFGYKDGTQYEQIGTDFIPLEELFSQGVMTGRIFFGGRNAYVNYRAFSRFVRAVPLTLVYEIRRGPGKSYPKTGKFTGVGVFNVVEESDGWGLLKAYQEKRDGWISLAFTTRI